MVQYTNQKFASYTFLHLEHPNKVRQCRADPNTSGPEYITLTDPDGNNILIDQHR